MKKNILLLGTAALTFSGCASSDDYPYTRYHNGRTHVTEEYPNDREVIVDREGNRTYVREYDARRSAEFQNNMEPRVRGKHAESLGWNTENYYLQRGY